MPLVHAQDRTTDGERPRPEQILERIGSRAHGIVTRDEAIEAGVTRAEIAHRLEIGSLLSVHRAVYRLGHRAPSDMARYMAAVKACGEGAVLSGLAAAHLHRLLRTRPAKVEVTSPKDRRIPGLHIHRARRLPVRRTHCHGIPVTTIAQTLVDITPRLTDEQLGRACHEAFVRNRRVAALVADILRERPNAPGRRRLTRILMGDDPLILSRMERAFLSLLRREKLPLPATNIHVGGHLVDCRWPDRHLTVELDSYTFHGSRQAWERDHRRDREARRRGDELLRYTWADVIEDNREMLSELRPRLG